MLRVDNTGFGNLKIYQETEAFCYGVDSVLLADYAARNSKRFSKEAGGQAGNIIDLGTGNGAVALIMSHKIPDSFITGVEIQKEQAELALRSIRENDLEDRMRIICSDIMDIGEEEYGKYDIVTCNPPYVKFGAGIKSDNAAKMTARHETTAGIEDFVKVASMLLKDDGNALFVYRPSRLKDLFKAAEKADLYISEIQMVHPYAHRNANIVLSKMTKKNIDLKVLPQMIVREDDGEYTDRIDEIYERDAKRHK